MTEEIRIPRQPRGTDVGCLLRNGSQFAIVARVDDEWAYLRPATDAEVIAQCGCLPGGRWA